MAEDKILPSEDEVRELGQQGIFPYSPYITATLCFVTTLVSVGFAVPSWHRMIGRWRDFVVHYGHIDLPGTLKILGSSIATPLKFGVILSIGSGVAALLSIVLQTRLRFSFSTFSSEVRREKRLRNLSLILRMWVFLWAVAVSAAICTLFSPSALQFLHGDSEVLIRYFGKFYLMFSLCFLLIVIGVGVIAWAWSRLIFRFRHRTLVRR